MPWVLPEVSIDGNGLSIRQFSNSHLSSFVHPSTFGQAINGCHKVKSIATPRSSSAIYESEMLSMKIGTRNASISTTRQLS